MNTKIHHYIIVLILITFFAVSCKDNDIQTDELNGRFEQFTPDQANWATFDTKPFEGGTNTAHDPDGVGWLTQESWSNAEWDGTVYDPTTMSKEKFADCLCPGGDQIRGIREVFYETNPFQDVKNPTKAEVDEWHRIAINHIRALVGYTSEDRKSYLIPLIARELSRSILKTRV